MATKVLPFNLFTGEQKNISAKDEPIHIAASPDVALIATKQGNNHQKNSYNYYTSYISLIPS